jgi:hypothetical protein
VRKKGIGDRRGRPRFEIVGTLTGTLETWRRLEIRNLGVGGALLDTSTPLLPGSRIGGRLSLRGRVREIRGEVRHITTIVGRDATRYLVGVQWHTALSVADLESLETLRPVAPSVAHVPERRASLRFLAGTDAELDQPTWSTVNLVDVSTTGVLFSSPVPLDVGERGELRVRFGEGSFAAQLEVRRTEVRKTPHLGYRAGAVFVSLDDVSRLHLEDFIGDARH